MTADALDLWHQPSATATRRSGRLWREASGRMGFRYDAEWRRLGFPISRQLPLNRREFSPAEGLAHRFFANLLPEGDARLQLARSLESPNTDFDLLYRVGGECAGAFCLLPIDQPPHRAVARYREYRELTAEDLTRLVLRRGFSQSTDATSRPRLSLAGAQHKCPVLLRGERCFLPLNEAPSTHILKFELTDYRHVPLYETFTTALASMIDLPVVDVALRSVRRHRYTVIGRFDRHVDSTGDIRRSHQEDFCQALGYGHTRKYEADDGPTFAECVRLVREASTSPAVDMQHLLRWQAFNWLAGNADGHAKNLALHYENGATRLAPFYDLVCTHAIPRLNRHLALRVGGESDPGQIKASHWRALADRCGIKPRFVEELVVSVAGRLASASSGARTDFERRYGAAPALQRIEQVVARQCRRVLNGTWQR